MGEFKQKRFSRGNSKSFVAKPFDRSNFFNKDKPEGRLQRFDSNREGRSSELELFKATCDKCKSECEVPFKPRGSKPVLCRDCYKQSTRASSDGTFEDYSHKKRSFDRPSSSPFKQDDSLAAINRKLDKIMRALKIE